MIRLTKAAVANLSSDGADCFIWEESLPGFGVRAKASGRKTYILQYRNKFGRSRRMTLGNASSTSLDNARKIARDRLQEISDGQDPLEISQGLKNAPTLSHLIDRYLSDHCEQRCKESTLKAYKWLTQKYITPRLGQFKVQEITRPTIEAFHKSISSQYNANRCLGLLKSIFNKAEDWNLIAAGGNPANRVSPYPEKKRERFLSSSELSKLLSTIDTASVNGDVSWQAAGALKLLIYTGCRLGEVLALEWGNVEFELRRLRLDAHKTDKQRGTKYVPLNSLACDLLLTLHKRATHSNFVFPGDGKSGHIINLRKPWTRVLSRAGLHGVRLHDLRHTFASMAAQNGISLQAIGALLGHSSIQSTQRYAKLTQGYLADQSEITASAIQMAISPN